MKAILELSPALALHLVLASLALRQWYIRKPYAVRHRVIATFAALLATSFGLRAILEARLAPAHDQPVDFIVFPIVVAVGVAVWFAWRDGVILFGADERGFRVAVRQALDDAGVVYDEWPDRIVIIPQRVVVRFSFGAGTAVVRIAPRSERALLSAISGAIVDAYTDVGGRRGWSPLLVNAVGGFTYVALMLLLPWWY